MKNISLVCGALAAAGAFAFLLLPVVHAQDPGNSRAGDPMKIYLQAGIDSQQEGKIKSLVKDYEQEASKRAELVFRLSKQIFELSMQPEPDGNAIMDKQADINKLQAQSANEKLRLLLKIRQTLRLDQKRKLVQIIRSRQQAKSRSN